MKRDFSSDAEENREIWPHQVLSRDEVRHLEAVMPHVSLWSVFKIQLFVGLTCVVLAFFFSASAGVNAAAGVLSVCLPTALFVWRVGAVKAQKYGSHFALVNFYIWEAIKVISIIAMLAAAFFFIRPLVWSALLAGFVVTVKAYSVGCWLSLKKINR